MFKQTSVKLLSLILTVIMLVGIIPVNVLFAGSVGDYNSFVSNLKVLEEYADAYSATSGKDANELVINFIRTGVERYNDGNWVTLAGAEITEFTAYVESQDSANGTTAMDLRDIVIDDFVLPNGQQVDFGHMFGTMNIAYVAATATADLGGWAGDLCDLLLYSKNYGSVPEGTVEEMADYVRVNCFGVNADDAFGMDDFYGDMDAFYLITELKAGVGSLSSIMDGYYTEELSDSDRAAYFLNNRFSGLETKDDVRAAILNAYTSNVGLKVLESDRGIADEADLRTACCYAFADYLFDLAGDRLEGDTGEGEIGDNAYYTVFSSTDSTLAPGITQTIKYAQTADNKQIVYYVATVDVNRPDVTIMANYKDNDPSNGWGMQRVEDQTKALVNKYASKYENFNAIVATNADGYNMSTGEPGGLLVMDGVEWHAVDGDGFFAILEDGSAMIGTKADYATYKDQIKEAVGGFGATLIKDGEIAINKSTNYYTSRASRTAIGITAEGKVVMMVLDGRQEPFSAGGSMEEIAQIMLDAGCVNAVNLDGGGSTTYLAKLEGEDDISLVNRPSDGYARSVATSLVAVSTAKSSNEFDHANITSDYDYLTIGTSLNITASGVSNTGYAAAIPEGAVWQVSDETIGTITQDGVFTAAANGEVEVQLVANGEVVGSKTLYVVIPDTLNFEKSIINVVYGVPTDLPLVALYEGNSVAFNRDDIYAGVEYESAGTLEGITFTGDEGSGIRKTLVAALILSNEEAYCEAQINLYKADEAYFDFDNATSGNRTLAWLREVSNAVTNDNMLYQIVTPGDDMTTDYTFALDMTTIEIPSQLADLTYMLPGADTGATAWDFLLQLAERVSVLTEVKITVQFDTDLVVDISEIKVSNDYFYLKNAIIDENNVLTITCGWYDQTQAIDAATANPICILSGIKATPKEGASWDADDQLIVKNTGNVSYKIYLRASSLYSFANKPDNQAQYGLYPFENPDVIIGGTTEKGAYFGSTYADFEDSYVLDKSVAQGWSEVDNELYYYVDNIPVTGLQYLPSYEDETVKLYYTFDENGVCMGKYTGIVEEDGLVKYSWQGALQKGWQFIEDENGGSYYYFDPYTYGAVNGALKVEGYNYVFEDYKLIRGEIVKNSTGYRYRFANFFVRNQWVELEGDLYYIGNDYYLETNGFYWVRTIDGTSSACYLFDEYGVMQQDYTGLYHVGEDTYYVENGVRVQEAGLVYIDGYYYYFNATAKAIKNCTYWPSKTNGLLPAASYQFDEQGRMINPPVVEPEEPETPEIPDETVKNGFVEENGDIYYYVDGYIQYNAGLILVDGDYYYVRSTGKLATGNYWITKTNGLLDKGMYTFGTDGKMIVDSDDGETDEPETEVKNGLVSEYGALYYYKNGKLQYGAGLILVDGYYYYIRSNGQAAVGNYWATTTNGLLPQAMYTFGADGKMIVDSDDGETDEPEEPEAPEVTVKDGFVSENGAIYYYKNGAIQYCAGLIYVDGYYYYVRSNGQVAHGQYWTTNTNDLLPAAMYTFDAEGKMIDPPVTDTEEPDEGETETPETPVEPEVKNGIVDVNGVLYYYENDVIKYGAGLVQLEDGAYIYVRSNGQLAIGKYWTTNHNGLLPAKEYTFGEDGKLYL